MERRRRRAAAGSRRGEALDDEDEEHGEEAVAYDEPRQLRRARRSSRRAARKGAAPSPLAGEATERRPSRSVAALETGGGRERAEDVEREARGGMARGDHASLLAEYEDVHVEGVGGGRPWEAQGREFDL